MKTPESEWATLCREFERQQKSGAHAIGMIARSFARSATPSEDDLDIFEGAVENMEGIIRRMRDFLKSAG